MWQVLAEDLWITAAIYQPFSIAFKDQVPKDFFSDTVGSRDATFCPKAEQDKINIAKIDNNASRMKKQMKHMNKLPSVLCVLVSIWA